MKEQLIETLYKEFEKEKEVIKENLLKVMNEIILSTKIGNETLTLIIKYEKIEK